MVGTWLRGLWVCRWFCVLRAWYFHPLSQTPTPCLSSQAEAWAADERLLGGPFPHAKYQTAAWVQTASDAQAEAWAAAERSLVGRAEEAEARAAGATERERHAADRVQVWGGRGA